MTVKPCLSTARGWPKYSAKTRVTLAFDLNICNWPLKVVTVYVRAKFHQAINAAVRRLSNFAEKIGDDAKNNTAVASASVPS